MKVALVHDWLTGMRGGEKCLEIFCEIFPEADLYTLVYDPNTVSSTIRRMNVRPSWIDHFPGARRYFRYFLPLFPKTIESLELGDYDLVLSSSHCVAKGIIAHRALHVAYIFTPMRYLWDMADSYAAGGTSLVERAGLSLCRPYLRRWDLRSTERVHQLIAISNHVAAKIDRIYGRAATVIYPPVDVDKFYVADDFLQPYYLIVSALVPYKRIDIAVDAFNRLQLPLKIAGDGPLRSFLQRRAKANIEFLERVDDAQLAELYSQCQALIFPGEEDFGIVPLEAQASGRPVIGFKKGGLLETVIGLDGSSSSQEYPTGLFFSEQRAESLIAAVELYQKSQGQFRPDQIRQHAAKFSRERFKQESAEYVDACVKQFCRNR
jgi:glycosyltransferase involved in cell wall biosynthesis